MKKSFQQGKKYQLVFLQARSYNWRKKKEFCRRSISATFYKQLLHPYSFAKKNQRKLYLEKSCGKHLVQKMCLKNVDEIDTCTTEKVIFTLFSKFDSIYFGAFSWTLSDQNR